MKKHYLICLLVFGLNAFGQEYKFDSYFEYNVSYNNEIKNDNNKIFILINSKDSTYFFRGHNNYEKLHGYLFDMKNKETYTYNVHNFNDSLVFKQIFIEKGTHTTSKKRIKKYEYHISKSDSASDCKLEITKNKINKKRSEIAKLTIVSKKEGETIFHNQVLNWLNGAFLEDLTNFQGIDNKVPFLLQIEDEFKNKFKEELFKIRKINTTLTVNTTENIK